MQLSNLNGRLAAATCALLGVAAPNLSEAADNDTPWVIDSSLLLYSEADKRVQAVEPVINLSKDYGDQRTLNLRLTLDTLTGASPNGATPTNKAQTFTGPSGNGSYQTSAGELPLDSTFKDTRGAFNASWSQPWGENNILSFGGNLSSEHDFHSLGGNLNLAHDFNQHNTTLATGLSFEYDLIKPVGGTPKAGHAMLPFGSEPENETEDDGKDGGTGSETRHQIDALLGITQVISPRLLMQFNYSLGRSNGYHNDPYKILSVINGNTGETNGYVFERRPDSRLRQSLFAQAKYAIGEDVLDTSYRFYTDDWGIRSHTLDLAYRWEFGAGHHYLQPHVRYYQQSAADFYHHSLVAGSGVDANGNLPDGSYASADPRLAKFTATTLGLKYGYVMAKNHEASVRFDYYQQKGTDHPADAIGIQKQYDLFPETRAYIVQFGYSFTW